MAQGRRRHEAAAVGAAVVVTCVLTVLAFRLWRADLGIAIGYGQRTDSKLYLSWIKAILDHGWYLHNANLGAPFGQDLRDYPTGDDNLNFLLIKALGVFSSNAGLVMNVFLLLGFPLVALSAYFAFRRLGVSPATTVVCSVLFALLPYHFYEREGHLFLAGYYAVPLGAYLVLSVLAGAPLFSRRRGVRSPLAAWASGGSLLTLAMCVVIGSTGQTYYGVFTVILVLLAMLGVFAARRDSQALLTGGLVCVVITAVLAVNMLPTLIYRARHGTDVQLAHRLPSESKKYGLEFSQMVLPSRTHRISALAELGRRYNDNAPKTRFCEPCSATLGIVPSAGLLWLFVVGLAVCIGARRSFAQRPLFLYAAAASAIALLVGSVGGISALISYFVNSEIRAWDRLSVFVAFFSLLAVGLLLDLLRRRWASGRARLAFGGALAVTLLGGVFDQTSNEFVPDYRVDRRESRSDVAFVHAIERRLPGHAEVLQLPYTPFPEAARVNHARLALYEPIRGDLNSRRLRWSFGAIKGRPQDWLREFAYVPVHEYLPGAVAAGFSGLWLDRFGYRDRGARVAGELTRLMGEAPLRSLDHRFLFFDLTTYRRRVLTEPAAALAALRRATLRPLQLEGTQHAGVLRVVNPSRDARRGFLDARISTGAGTPLVVTASYPDGTYGSYPVGPAGTEIRHVFSLPHGASRVKLSVTGRDGRHVSAAVLDVPPTGRTLVDVAVAGSA